MQMWSRRSLLALSGGLGAGLVTGTITEAATGKKKRINVYKSPSCGCCGAWVDHMRSAGFDVRVTELQDLEVLKARYGVPEDLQSCHTGVIDNYVIEGHVPAWDVSRLLTKHPEAIGLSVPGMPVGSPGMEQGSHKEPYDVVLFTATERRVFARYGRSIRGRRA